jgi:hypothetical protein
VRLKSYLHLGKGITMKQLSHIQNQQPPAAIARRMAWTLALTQRLPVIRGAGRLAQAATWLCMRRQHAPVTARILGAWMRLDPQEFLEQVLLFYPQFWDTQERGFLRQQLCPGDTFVDIGAHVGFYTLACAGN